MEKYSFQAALLRFTPFRQRTSRTTVTQRAQWLIVAACLIGVVSQGALATNTKHTQPKHNHSDTKTSVIPLNQLPNTAPQKLEYKAAQDGTQIAFRVYEPRKTNAKSARNVAAVLIFYHGTGSHSALGYPAFAKGLSDSKPVAVITPDMRGHGFSAGPRGDTTTIKAMFDDINSIIDEASIRYPDTPIYLGGHSSGAGLVLNYTGYAQKKHIDGLVFVAPYLGFLAKTEWEGRSAAGITVDFLPFTAYSKDGSQGHTKAVFYQFPDQFLKQNPELVTSISVLMSHATTPQWPHHQLADIQLPIGAWIGERDEGFDPSKVKFFMEYANSAVDFEIMPKQTHLTVLAAAPQSIGTWILKNQKD